MHVVLIFCLALLLVSCGALPESDPRGEWRMEEWSSVIEEGRAFHESKRRPWSQRLEL